MQSLLKSAPVNREDLKVSKKKSEKLIPPQKYILHIHGKSDLGIICTLVIWTGLSSRDSIIQ